MLIKYLFLQKISTYLFFILKNLLFPEKYIKHENIGCDLAFAWELVCLNSDRTRV